MYGLARGSFDSGSGFAAHGWSLGLGLNMYCNWTSEPSKNSGS